MGNVGSLTTPALRVSERAVEILERLRARQINLTRVERHRGEADQLLGSVEQRRELLTGRLEAELLQPVRDTRAAHHVGALLGAIDAVEVRLRLRKHQKLALLAGGRAADVLRLHRHRVSGVGLILPGFLLDGLARGAKQLGLLHELVPKAAVIAVLGDPSQQETELGFNDVESAGRVLGRKILIVKASSEHEFAAAFATIVQAGAGALLVLGGPVFLHRRRQLVALAMRHALPASYVTRQYPEAGGLMSYGPSLSDAYRRAGTYVGRILRGAKPVDLPVELFTKFDLVINLATAKAMSIDIPPTLLALADEVIE
jgi:hypothetical protein